MWQNATSFLVEVKSNLARILLNRIFIGFAAGCMIYVVAEEMVPEMKGEGHDHFGVWAFIAGFTIMMMLDCIQF